MKRSSARFACLMLIVLSVAACGSTGPAVPFVRPNADYTQLPVETVQFVAADLEGFVAAEDREPKLENRADFVIDTPEIRQAMRSRAARYALVQELLDTGHTLEQQNGKIAILRTRAYKKAFTSRERDRHALIVISENRDRVVMNESLQDANNLSPQTRVAIEEIFAKERISRLKSGQKYESDSGEPAVR